ncbi:MAG: ferrous iron transport protein A [Lachnospiraceae bacterium]|nr:ferrous iron transport protein A [Lachnospiraceae bacterium]
MFTNQNQTEGCQENIIRKIGGKQEVKIYLENLGFVVVGEITVINAIGGNVIVKVKDSRIAVSREMAQKIMI